MMEKDVTIDATPLSVKIPNIYCKIYQEGKKSFFKIIRADGKTQMYLTFTKILKNFDREDLEVLWRIVKDRFKKTEPVNYMDIFLHLNLKTMFEHHVEDRIWKNQQGLVKVLNWKLFDSYGCSLWTNRAIRACFIIITLTVALLEKSKKWVHSKRSRIQQNQEFVTGHTDEQPDDKATLVDWFKKLDCPLTPDPYGLRDSVLTTDLLKPRSVKLLMLKTLLPHLMSTCKSHTKLEYHFKECFKATNERLDWHNPEGKQYLFDLHKPLPLIQDHQVCQVIPKDYFINNDLEYLKVMKWYDYGYLEEIVVRREDDTIHKFKEGDFSNLNLHDIEDMLLLLVQKKISNLSKAVIFELNVALRMFTRRDVIQKRVEDLQLGVESYKKKLNITRPETFISDISNKIPYTPYNNPRGVYQDKLNRNKLMRSDELYKFCNGTLTSVKDALQDIVFGLHMEYLQKKYWSEREKSRSRIMIKATDKMLYERRLIRNLEKFVGSREYGEDFRLLERTNEQYFKIQDLKAQLLGKNIAISELKKLIEKCKEKSVDTKFDKPSIVQQQNAQRIPKPSVLGKPTLFLDSLERKSFEKTKSITKTNESEGLSKSFTTRILPQIESQAVRNTNVIKPGMYQIDTRTTQTRASQLPRTSRNTNSHMSTSTGVIHNTSVRRPQLRSTQMKEKVMQDSSHVKSKKTEVEDHHRISSILNKTKSATACNDSLKCGTSNANVVCATCGKCMFNSNHDACVSKFINDVNARTKNSKVVPINTRKPTSQANKSVATPHKKTVASDSTIQKSKSYYRMLYENTSKAWKWWIEKQCPSGYKWVLKTKMKWVPKIRKEDVTTSNNLEEIEQVKQFLSTKFLIKYLGKLKYFLGIKFIALVRLGKCKVTRKFVTGFVVYLGNNLVSWESKKQSVLARSSAEAEFKALCSVICEIADGIIRIVKVKSEENVANILTKGLSVTDHKRLCDLLKLKDLFHS
ncbi:hypothetical protein Tco_0532072 [Tanacetum coccineum]